MSGLYSPTAEDALGKRLRRRLDRLKEVRQPREAEWTEIAKYFDPRKEMTFGDAAKHQSGQRASNRIYTSAGILYSRRCAAMLAGYLVDYSHPFLAPNVERHFMATGKPFRMGSAEQEYLQKLMWQIYYLMMAPKSGFQQALALTLDDYVKYGFGVDWKGKTGRNEIRFRHRSFKHSYLDADETGEVDTLYYEDFYPLHRVKALYPQAQDNAKFRQLCESGKSDGKLITVMFSVEPRAGEVVKGGVPGRKPYALYVWLPEFDNAVVQESGYDVFPFGVARRLPTEGNPYGSGMALDALADVKVLDHYQMGLETNLDLINEPPMLVAEGIFSRDSFKAGKFTSFDLNALGFQDPAGLARPINAAGAVAPVANYMAALETRIGEHFFTDWMKLRESGNMTATEVNERRDLRVRSMSSLVPGLDRELLGHGADRVLDILVGAGLVAEPPQALSGVAVDWDYAGPLANAMRANQVDVLTRMIGMWSQIMDRDPEAAYAFDVPQIARNWVDRQGAEPDTMRSLEAVAAWQRQREEERQQAAQVQAAQMGAQGFRDGAQGVASLANAGAGEAGPALAQALAA